MGNTTYYAVLDIKKIHSFGELRAQEAHNNREYKMNHVDENMSYLNKEVVSTGGLSYTERWKEIATLSEIKTGKKIKPRKNNSSVLVLDIVVTFTPEANTKLKFDIDEWCEENKKWVEKTFGKENILAITLHMDENTPHLHIQVAPIDERGHLCARSFTGGRTNMKNLQTSYGKAMSKFGLSRGEPNSKLKTQSRKRWYKTVGTICEAKAPRIQAGETMENYLDRLDKEFQDINIRAEKAIESANKRVALSETRQAQIFGEYAYAINLQHILEEQYSGDMTLVNERLKKYQLLEKAVPRKNLYTMIEKMLEKYPPENSLNFWRRGKKKKHAKWESIPDGEVLEQVQEENTFVFDYGDNETTETTNTKESQSSDIFSSPLGNAIGEELED